jgi:uncharacterized protein
MSGLLIDTRRLRERPERFRLEADAGWWDRTRETVHEPSLRLIEPFALELEGHALGRRLLFRGALRGRVELVCGRCAEGYPLEFDERVELLLEPALDPEAIPAGGIELDPEDNALGRYSGEELDFEPVLNETLWLAWPMQPCCREDCRGLCPRCGVNRNQETCGCDAAARPSPFADLAVRLAARGTGGGSGTGGGKPGKA